MHVARAHLAAILGPLLGHEGAAHGPFAADPNPGEQSADGNFPDVLPERRQKCEKRVAQDRQREGAHAAKPVGDRSPDQSQSPADKKQGEQQSTVEASVGRGRRDAGLGQQFAHGRDKNQRIDKRVHAVESPTGPGGPKASDLILGERDLYG